MESQAIPSTSAADPTLLQQRLYVLTDKLRLMAEELPPKYRQRLPNELLSGIAYSLLDNSVFKIVKSLMDIQHVTEKHLFQQRLQLTVNQSLEIQNMLIEESDERIQFQKKKGMKVRHQREVSEMDKKIVAQLDERVHEQQRILEKTGVPGFEVTDDTSKIKVQMRILDFILRLSQMDLKE